jgi:hypothetical protein
MKPTLRHQLTHLDRTIVELLNERAQLCLHLDSTEAQSAACIDDLLRRSSGPFEAEALREIFAAIERGCRGEAP